MAELQERLQAALGDAYRIERELGGGGMSRVFVATETELGRKVVVKVLPPEMAAGVNADRFRREIQLAASLQHPHIVPLLRAGRSDDLVWYTMPLVEGESLRARLAREGELPVPVAVRVLRDVAAALAYAHDHGVVHRDIKPDNILLTHAFAVVTDFGVAKAVSEATGEVSLTSLGVALGTPAYMAPEQAAADPNVDYRADIYALGAIAYEMLSGRTPFTMSSPQAMLAAHVTQAPDPVTQHRDSVPPALGALVMRCLAKKPADRWQSAAELHQQFDVMATPSGGTAPTHATLAASGASAPPTATLPLLQRVPARLGLVLVAVAIVAAAVVIAPRLGRNAGAAATPERPTLIVLPFQNLGPPADEYFADGMTEEITSRLAELSGLGVISRTTAARFGQGQQTLREIGAAVGAQYVLEGTVRWQRAGQGDQVRISAQLIRVSDDTHLWAESFDADLTQVFQVQSDVAGRVASALDVALLAREDTALARRPTESVAAYDAYLKARAHLRRDLGERTTRQALESFERAVELDPGFALAWAWLSKAHAQMYWFGYDLAPARLEQARRAAERALELDPQLPDAHVAMGYYYYWGSRDYDRALPELEAARRLRPGDPEVYGAIANVTRRQGRIAESIENRDRELALDPNNVAELQEIAATLIASGRYQDAERNLDRAAALAPADPVPTLFRAYSAALQGDTVLAHRHLAALPSAESFDMSSAYNGIFSRILVGFDAALDRAIITAALPADPVSAASAQVTRGLALRYRGDSARARAVLDSARADLERLSGKYSAGPFHGWMWSDLGLAAAALGRRAEALRAAERAVEFMPTERDAYLGPALELRLAIVLAWTGDADRAVRVLAPVIDVPSEEPMTRAWLRYAPAFRVLRGDAGFERLVAGR